MKVYKSSIFVLALAVCMVVGLLPLHAIVPVFAVPTVISVAGANPEDDPAEPRILEEANDTGNDLLRTENELESAFDGTGDAIADDFDDMEGNFDDIEGIVGIEAISADLDEAADDAGISNWIIVAIVVVVLIAAGAAAYYFALKKKDE